MAGFHIRTVGLLRIYNALSGLVEAAEAEHDWWVGTVVTYSAFLEFGTRKMPARPFFQPAILRVARKLGADHEVKARTVGQRMSGRSLWALMVGDERGLVAKVAFSLEREVKVVIREKGLILTGNLRGSIVAAPTLPVMREESLKTLPLFYEVPGQYRLHDRSSIVDLES